MEGKTVGEFKGENMYQPLKAQSESLPSNTAKYFQMEEKRSNRTRSGKQRNNQKRIERREEIFYFLSEEKREKRDHHFYQTTPKGLEGE